MEKRSFKTFNAAVSHAIPSASFAEVDYRYRSGMTATDAIEDIKRCRKAVKDFRKRSRETFEGSDHDHSMNG